MERMVIVIACDDNYAPYCGILITSIFENNKDYEIVINVLTDFFSDDNKNRFNELEINYNQKINIITIDKEQFAHLPLDNRSAHINICAYYRLIIPNLFPNEEKILYLDVDMIVRKELKDLWNTDMEDYAFAAVKDTWQMQGLCNHLQYPRKEFYFNSGMLLFNIKYLNEIGYKEIIESFIKEHFDLIVCHDQDILNACFHGRFKAVSTMWNMFITERNYNYVYDDVKDFLQCRIDPAIVHYTGAIKPWYKDSLHPYKKDFDYYAKISPWSLSFTYKTKLKQRLKMYLKFYILEFLGRCGFNCGNIRPAK